MDWKRNYRVAKRFYETLKWTGNIIDRVAKRFYETLKWTGNIINCETILRDVKMDWKIIELRNDSTRR